MPQIYYCDTDELREFWQQGMALVTEKRREKAQRLIKEEDRLASLGTGLLLKCVLNISSDKDIKYNEHGKPYFEHGKYFSVSHSGNIAVLAVSDDEIGIDIERLRKPNERIIRRCFTEAEAEFAEKSNQNFTRIWTEKEAVLKLLGKGLAFPPKSFSLIPGQKKYDVLDIRFGIFCTEINKMPLSAAFCGSNSAFVIRKLSAVEMLEI